MGKCAKNILVSRMMEFWGIDDYCKLDSRKGKRIMKEVSRSELHKRDMEGLLSIDGAPEV